MPYNTSPPYYNAPYPPQDQTPGYMPQAPQAPVVNIYQDPYNQYYDYDFTPYPKFGVAYAFFGVAKAIYFLVKSIFKLICSIFF